MNHWRTSYRTMTVIWSLWRTREQDKRCFLEHYIPEDARCPNFYLACNLGVQNPGRHVNRATKFSRNYATSLFWRLESSDGSVTFSTTALTSETYGLLDIPSNLTFKNNNLFPKSEFMSFTRISEQR